MRRSLLAALAPLVALAAVVVANPTRASGAVGGWFATYYACPSGYDFQAQGNAARCYRPPRTETVSLNACANVTIPVVNISVGTFARTDYSGRKDMCVGQSGPHQTALDRSCPPGYTEREVAGTDRCEKTLPADIKAPTVPVSI